MFTYELQRRLARKDAPTEALAAHPGSSQSELTRNIPGVLRPVAELAASLIGQSPDMGALPTLRAAADPAAQGGQYYGPDGFFAQRGHPKVAQSSEQSQDQAQQSRLWAVSEELTGVTYPV